jgi:hypothetical protein
MRQWLARRMLLATARHEAAHCVVARKLGLEVQFVAVQPHRVVAASRLEATLYQGHVAEDEAIPAMLTRLHDESWEQDPQAVLAAMVAPSYIRTGSLALDAYARWERRQAVRFAMGQREELDFCAVGRVTARDSRKEIERLAHKLVKRGRIWF